MDVLLGTKTGVNLHTNNDYWKTGVFIAQLDDQMNTLKAQLRADNITRPTTFRLEKDDDPLYRRFNVAGVDADDANDTPKILKFHSMDRPAYELFENTGFIPTQANYWTNYGKKNYLGQINTNQYPEAANPKSPTAIFVDTAYINRGTGWIKPQYMLVVDPVTPEGETICDDNGELIDITFEYLRGRYLINATDSARGVGTGAAWNTYRSVSLGGVAIPEYDGRNYIWPNNWERLVFTDAIHSYTKDALYLIAGVDLKPYMYGNSSTVVDINKLDAASAPKGTALTAAKPIRKVYLGDNSHKDVVFSMRLIERGANDFIIESETGKPTNAPTANRIWGTSYGQTNSDGPQIAPCFGAWIKVQNYVPVLSRSDVLDNIGQSDRMNTRRTTQEPVANDKVTVAAPTVIGGADAVTILGAAGKKVAISNVLGQTVASVVLTSDNATIAAPKGVVVVAIEGQTAVKALVK
jgi:hypothetical protein